MSYPDDPYDELMESLTIRGQTRRVDDARAAKEHKPGRLRRLLGWSIYVLYVTLDFLVSILHDIAVLIRDGRSAEMLTATWKPR